MAVIFNVAGTLPKIRKKKKIGAVKTPIQYKGYTINYIRGEYRAEAYGNPQFTDTNLSKLKSKINKYLRS